MGAAAAVVEKHIAPTPKPNQKQINQITLVGVILLFP
jgi:hypothetical protein